MRLLSKAALHFRLCACRTYAEMLCLISDEASPALIQATSAQILNAYYSPFEGVDSPLRRETCLEYVLDGKPGKSRWEVLHVFLAFTRLGVHYDFFYVKT